MNHISQNTNQYLTLADLNLITGHSIVTCYKGMVELRKKLNKENQSVSIYEYCLSEGLNFKAIWSFLRA